MEVFAGERFPTEPLLDGRGHEFLGPADGVFQRKPGSKAGGDGGGISAASAMSGDAADKPRRQFDEVAARKQNIDSVLAGQMAAFQQHRRAIFVRERLRRLSHSLLVWNFGGE